MIRTHAHLEGRTASLTDSRLRSVTVIVAASVLLAVSAHIAVPLPFTPVPLTLQSFAIVLLGLMMGPLEAAIACALYLVEGAVGLPVFSPHGIGGIAQLFGPSGGYLMAAPLAAFVAGLLFRGRRSFWLAAGAAAVGIAILLTAGASWFALETHAQLTHIFVATVAPFLPGEAVKICAAAGIASAVRSRR